MQIITGNTYPVKEQLKALPGGARWNKAANGWEVADTDAEAARALVANAGPSTYTPRRQDGQSRYRSNYARFSGGGEWYQNKKGRCEDAPCCGCCS
jgi:hypothetical protein